MFPILLSLGPIKIYTYGVAMALGLFTALYYWWKMGRDEHFDEIALFDGYFLSAISFLVGARIGYVLLNLGKVGSLYRSLAILAFPGLNIAIGVVIATIFMIYFARAQNWDVWKVGDSYSVTMALASVFAMIGHGLNATLDLKLNILNVVWAILMFVLVFRVRKDFRFYSWYKGEASTAQEGLASLVYVLGIGIYFLLKSAIGFVSIAEIIGAVVMICASLYMIEQRVGRRDNTLWGRIKGLIRRK